MQMCMDTYQTSDFTEAVVLRYNGHKIRSVDRSERRAVFYFDISYDTEEILNKYKIGELLVEPRSFYLCEREMKDYLYSN